MTADVTERPEDPTGQPAGPDQARPSMSDGDDVARLMQLLHKADSVELKVTVPTDAQLSTIRSLPIDPIAAQTRQVFFFDTPDLDQTMPLIGIETCRFRVEHDLPQHRSSPDRLEDGELMGGGRSFQAVIHAAANQLSEFDLFSRLSRMA